MKNILLGLIRPSFGAIRLRYCGSSSRKCSEGQLLSLLQWQRFQSFRIWTAITAGSIVSMINAVAYGQSLRGRCAAIVPMWDACWVNGLSLQGEGRLLLLLVLLQDHVRILLAVTGRAVDNSASFRENWGQVVSCRLKEINHNLNFQQNLYKFEKGINICYHIFMIICSGDLSFCFKFSLRYRQVKSH